MLLWHPELTALRQLTSSVTCAAAWARLNDVVSHTTILNYAKTQFSIRSVGQRNNASQEASAQLCVSLCRRSSQALSQHRPGHAQTLLPGTSRHRSLCCACQWAEHRRLPPADFCLQCLRTSMAMRCPSANTRCVCRLHTSSDQILGVPSHSGLADIFRYLSWQTCRTTVCSKP